MVVMGMVAMRMPMRMSVRMSMVSMAIMFVVIGRLAEVDTSELRVQRCCRLVAWVWAVIALTPREWRWVFAHWRYGMPIDIEV
jgi:hypothetical protein